MLKVYCDVNILMDYNHSRKDKYRPLGDFAYDLFNRGWNCHFELVVSDWLFQELEKHISKEKIQGVLDNFKEKDKLIYVKSSPSDRSKAKELSEHWQDALHAILAQKAGCDHLVTRNIKDFEGCEDLVDITFPESV